MVIRGLLWLSLLLSLPALAISQLNARVDKNPVMLGESVILEVTADSRLPANSINFRVLDGDFSIMVPSVNQSTRVVNGEASHSTTWTVTLLPKASGTFTLPAFTIDNVSTQPLSVEVLPAQQGTGTLRDIFLQSKLSSDRVVVQQMVYYDVTIYFSGDIQRGSLSEPQLDNALIQQVGQDQEGSELIDGERYRSITRRYAITPQRSGNFSISPPTFSGDIIDRDNARQSYFARSRAVVREAQTLAIEVQAQTGSFSGNWLVAGLVTLNDEWQPNITELVQGEPITRIITLSAVDVAANQLPDLQLAVPDGFRVYQEQPQTRGAERAGRLVAQKIITSAIIANTPGEYQLPEVTVPWWNSQTNRMEQAVLPGRTLQVKADPNRLSTPAMIDPPLPQISSTTLPLPAVSPWSWNHTSTALALGWLLSSVLLLGLWRYQSSTASAGRGQTKPQGAKFDSRALRAACQKQDKAAARDQLLKWARQQNILAQGSLTALSQQITPGPLQQQLQQLNAALYSDSTVAWQAEQLLQAWSDYQLAADAKPTVNALPPLYPQ
ncbi:hypothetical protein WG68_02630 [Arsukibacterium ikkense]|uniref:DUF7939 domain-containing protein n=1 Tax=Arsukibacterium ikkense TaxID=336831 RepID=A0A0M2V7M9_9GAMM|nr:BatD family protein [Arsukibacterium ikkense]KKO46857.1 hypothetical protein WG68_02630 [Arsukibacterium ikkense]